MKTLQFLILFILCFQSTLFGQEKELRTSKWTIYTSTFDYLPNELNSANFNLGLETPLNKHQSIYLNLGLIHTYAPSTDHSKIRADKNVGINVKMELKNYTNSNNFFLKTLPQDVSVYPNSGGYYSFKLFSQYTNTTREENVRRSLGNDNYSRFDTYKNAYYVNRFAVGLIMNVGYKAVGKYGFTRDFTMGLGAQVVHSFYDGRIDDGGYAWTDQQTEGYWVTKLFDHGTALLPYIRFRLKLGWSHFK